jgi:magnesium transporter
MIDQAEQEAPTTPSQDLESLIEAGDAERLEAIVYELPSGEMAHTVSRLEEDEQSRLLTLLSSETAAFLIDELSHPQAADMLEELSAAQAAAILDEMPSDEQADLLGELGAAQAEAIIEEMAPEEAYDARLLTKYNAETAGGLMITEYLVFYESMTVDDILRDLRTNNEAYQDYDVQYVYVINYEGILRGVVRLRDLVMTPGYRQVQQIMIQDPLHVSVDADLDGLEELFDKYGFFALPVVDEQQRLTGVVRRSSIEEALTDRSDRSLLKFGGIIGGEEMRTMPVWSRAGRRLAFLTPNIVLNLISVSVIAFFQPTLESVVALAIFLPILSDMSGCSGNQAIAVSMRELALGLVKPNEIGRTLAKEVSVGLLNGIALGLLLGTIAWIMRGNEFAAIGLVIGAALAANSVIAVAIGGTVPLILKRFKLDPAMASGPILTTITDLCGFFFALGLAALLIHFNPDLVAMAG